MPTLSDFTAQTIDGREQDLERVRRQGRARREHRLQCGFTPQFGGLERLCRRVHRPGSRGARLPLQPVRQPGPGSAEEIAEFCQANYGVTFPMFAKVDVNGDNAHPLYQWLKAEKGGLVGAEDEVELHQVPDRPRRPVLKRFGSTTKPEEMTGGSRRR